MSGATAQLLSVQSRIREQPVQRNRGCRLRNGNSQMNVSTKPSNKPSLPVMRYRSFKMVVVASYIKHEFSWDETSSSYFQQMAE
jgi:hypothetical protein